MSLFSGDVKFSRGQGFFDKNRVIRWMIAFLLGLGLFIFIHFREISVDMPEFGRGSPRYVVAEVDFSFPDEEATTILKQEALLDVGKIYRIDPDEVKRRRVELENELIYDQKWRKSASQSTFDEIYRAIEQLEKTLFEMRFCDSRTIGKMKELQFPVKYYHELAPFDPSQGAFFTEKIWDFIQHRSFGGRQPFHPGTIEFVIGCLQDKIWRLKEETLEMRRVRKALQAHIPQKYTFVPAGSRIIDHGDKVTSRHVVMLQAMKQALNEKRHLWNPRLIVGSLAVTGLLLIVGVLFLRSQHPNVLMSSRRLFLLVCIILCGLAIAKMAEFILLKSSQDMVGFVRSPLLAPFTAILVACLVNPCIALFSSALMTVLFDMTLAFQREGFVMKNLLVAFFAILFIKGLRKRTEVFVVCGKSWFAYATLVGALYLYDNTSTVSLITHLESSLVFLLVTAVFVVGLIPVFESCFGILTDITLMEYMDPNHELLRRLTIEAPGTYQHSLITGTIAESAALAIGCNGLFCRVATLYHDVGKMAVAQYFTENQQSGVNIHQLLTPVESAQVIMSHVSEGVAMARKEGLPEQFIDIIKEHHGTDLVYCFYNRQLETVGGNRAAVNEKEFRYLGPKPRTKESVIIMIADGVEAASRTLEHMDEEAVTRLVDQIVQERMEDGQFDESVLTFEEVGRIKKAMVKSVLAIGHFRIKYPARAKQLSPSQLSLAKT